MDSKFSIETVGVVGAGTMGNGIAQVCARAGLSVVLHDVSEEFLQRGLSAVDKSLQRDVDKDRLKVDAKLAIIDRIKPVTYISALAGADLVVEAVTENFDVKAEVFRTLDELAGPLTILAS